MKFKSFRFKIIIRILCLTGGGALVAIGYLTDNPVLLVAGLALIIVGSIAIFTLFQSVNRKTAFFFDAIRNEDTTLTFPEKVPDKSVRLLHQSMNRVNERIKLWKRQMAYKERFYQELIEHSATGLVVFDDAGYVELINSTAKYYMGLHPKSNLKLLQQRSAVLHGLLLSLSPGKTETVRILVNDELCFLSVSLTIIKFENKNFRIYSLKNIRQELDEKELDSWQKLIRVLTHEIMNSLAPVTSIAQSLRDIWKDKADNAGQMSYSEAVDSTIGGLEVIGERGEGLIRFVKSYRMLSRIPEPNIEKVSVKNLFERLKILVSPLKGEFGVSIKFKIPGNNFDVFIDEQMMVQVILNLVKNAAEALVGELEPLIEIAISQKENSKTEITVSDNGPGIPDEIFDEIFVPFFTTKESGNGIGLSYSRQVMRAHGGSIHCRSKKGHTVFKIIW